MKKFPDKNNLSSGNQDSFESDFSLLENEADFVDGNFNGDDEEVDEGQDTMEEDSQPEENPEIADNSQTEKREKKQNESSSSEHDSTYFVVQKGKACCDQGSKFPNFKVTSHQKHYWNDEQGEADYLA
ncbi:hypothetical protein MKJ01_18515 [Chryseobacterium sp. SSA4.19]|uniref:hypothetical protein n=1 Tax=Chryseobacterium sp. SSA4.19 TaxID=2919915 RepID=UPI001F4F0C78|nr:hypothetical protein [Chryseobacterium sp. SSA4.19]MCJ8155753.1 hypothetical protein [Chryseobacterium sp. SSA4.19]